MHITYLKHQPEFLDTLAPLLYKMWGHHQSENTLAARYKIMQRRMNENVIPTCVIASNASGVLGTASLIECDCDERAHLTPWLATVFVLEGARSMGVGSLLVTRIEDEARLLKNEKIYLVTPDKESFYVRLGWQTIEHIDYHGEASCIMQKILSSSHGQQ